MGPARRALPCEEMRHRKKGSVCSDTHTASAPHHLAHEAGDVKQLTHNIAPRARIACAVQCCWKTLHARLDQGRPLLRNEHTPTACPSAFVFLCEMAQTKRLAAAIAGF